MEEKEEMKPTDMMKEIVILNGDSVEMGEPTCVLWKADHPNCRGCPSGLGCRKVVMLGLVLLSSSAYTPTSYDDFVKMTDRISGLHKRIIEAKTEEELEEIPMH